MELKPGTKLHSAVSEAQVIVVRAPAGEVEVGCGGAPMLATPPDAPDAGALVAELADGPLIGKRYADDDAGLELLCTRAGAGTLTVDGRPVALKGAKPLPASD